MEIVTGPYPLDQSHPQTRTPTSILKRGLDILICLVLLPSALVVIGIISFLILVDSGKPVFFVHTRVGQGGRRFRLFKFRTLHRDFQPSSIQQKMHAFIRGESRGPNGPLPQFHKPLARTDMTRVGHILRETSLDELPQFLNILRGDMSWVGPRPHVEDEVAAYAEWHHRRLIGLPGITGLAQVRGKRLYTFEQMVDSDLEYLARQSLVLDLKILFWTLLWVCFRRPAP